MLFLPFPEFEIEEETTEWITQRKLRWLDIVDGVLLPTSFFLVESHTDPELPLEKELTLHFNQDLRIQARANKKVTLYRASGDCVTWFRHYRQDSDGLRIVSPPPSQKNMVLPKTICSQAHGFSRCSLSTKGMVFEERMSCSVAIR